MKRNSRQCAFLLSEGGNIPDAMVLGGKGAGLVEMARLGVPVPPAFIVRTGVARAASQGQLSKKRLAWHIERCMRALERQSGKKFGDKSNPLLVSVRSGAAVSMPGMMDTILNLGVTTENFKGLVSRYGQSVAQDIRDRFVKMFSEVVFQEKSNVFAEAKIPQSPWKQFDIALCVVHQSWNSERAQLYRRENKIPDWWGTAVVVQAMVFGNLGEDSCSGVVFSRNVATGEPGLYGEFLVNSQGEDVVAGVRTPLPIARMKIWNSQIYGQLENIVRQLEKHYNDVVDVEFTVESGRLYILQCRVAKRTPEAALTIATHFVWDKRWTKAEALEKVTPAQISATARPGFDEKALAGACVIARGIPASPGAASGIAVFSSERAVALAKTGLRVVLVRPDTSPDDLPGIIAAEAVVTEVGGMTSHAAVVARSLGKPCVLSCQFPGIFERMVSVDGGAGLVVKGEIRRNSAFNKKEVNIFRRWAQGSQDSPGWPKPRLDFSLVDQSVTVNQVINDFYLSAAMASAAVGTGLAIETDRLMKRVHVEAAERVATYLALAVASELRYATSYANLDDEPGVRIAFAKLEKVVGSIYDGVALEKTRRGLQVMDTAAQIEFFTLAKVVFGDCVWRSSSFGGRKWAKIAEAGQLFLSGEYSHTVFADHAFDLQHNTGAVFGKHDMLVFDAGTLHHQLEIKKMKIELEELRRLLILVSSDVDSDVFDMFLAGQSQGLWGEKQSFGNGRKNEFGQRFPLGVLNESAQSLHSWPDHATFKGVASVASDVSGSMSASQVNHFGFILCGPPGTGKPFFGDKLSGIFGKGGGK